MDLPPPLRGGLGVLAFFQRRSGGGPAGTVRGDLPEDGLAQAVPQVPAVTGLDRAGQGTADRLAVGAGPVPAYDLHAGVNAQPRLRHAGGPARQDIDALPGLGVDHDGGVVVAAAQREVIDAQHAGNGNGRQREAQQHPQGGVPCQRDAQGRGQRGPGPAG